MTPTPSNLAPGVVESRDIDYETRCDRCNEPSDDLEGGWLEGLCVECREEE